MERLEKKQISAQEVQGVRIGHAELSEAGTGVSVLFFPNGAKVGCDISGGGPASRETPLTSPITADNPINAIVLSGGSAYGLAASDGVMQCLEENGIGYDTKAALVPLVLQSCIYDLGYKQAKIRPDAKLGREACEKALQGTDGRSGSIGSGCGASVGKLYGMERATKTGFGFASVQIGKLQVTAVVVLNAFGNVIDPTNGETIAGLRTADGSGFMSICEELYQLTAPRDQFTGNTTIGAIVTNADFSKAEMNKIASMTRCAYARCIYPVGTMGDGDSIYAASVGNVTADLNMVGTLAAEVMAQAILKAARV